MSSSAKQSLCLGSIISIPLPPLHGAHASLSRSSRDKLRQIVDQNPYQFVMESKTFKEKSSWPFHLVDSGYKVRRMTKTFNGCTYRVHCWVVSPGPAGRAGTLRSGSGGGVPYVRVTAIWLNSIIFLEPLRRVIFVSLSLWWLFVGKPVGMKRIWSGC